MIDLAHLFRDLWAWSLDKAEPWHNWAAHGLIAASIGLLIGVIAKALGVPFGVGPWTAASYYVLRESEELMLAWGFPASIDWKDHILDAGFPVVCSVIVYLVSLLLRYRLGCLRDARPRSVSGSATGPLSMNKPNSHEQTQQKSWT
jgi:hypothetical protein